MRIAIRLDPSSAFNANQVGGGLLEERCRWRQAIMSGKPVFSQNSMEPHAQAGGLRQNMGTLDTSTWIQWPFW